MNHKIPPLLIVGWIPNYLDIRQKKPNDVMTYYSSIGLPILSVLQIIRERDSFRFVIKGKQKTKDGMFTTNFTISYQDLIRLEIIHNGQYYPFFQLDGRPLSDFTFEDCMTMIKQIEPKMEYNI